MDSYRWGRGRPCEIDGCGHPSYRPCRVCQRVACRGHRHGAGWWVRCIRCSADELAEVMRSHHDQEREDRHLEKWVHCPCCGTALVQIDSVMRLEKRARLKRTG